MHDKKDSKLGDSWYNTKDSKWYYYDSENWVLPLSLIYKNYKGVVSERTVLPIKIYYGLTEYHREICYIIHCFDLDKKQYRDFKLTDIIKFL